MQVVEFLGPSGVGKTFLYQKLMEVNQRERNYKTLPEAYIEAASNCTISAGFNVNYFLRMLMQSPLKFKKRGIANHILHSQNKTELLPSSMYTLSFKILLSYLANEPEPVIVQKRINAFMRRIKQMSLLKQYINPSKLVVVDEGLIHYHHGLHPRILKQYSEKEIFNDYVFSPKAIISCELPANDVYERALKRKQSGVNTFSHRNLSDSQLKDYVFKNVEEYTNKIEFFQSLNIPVLKVNTNLPWKANIILINDFLNSLSG